MRQSVCSPIVTYDQRDNMRIMVDIRILRDRVYSQGNRETKNILGTMWLSIHVIKVFSQKSFIVPNRISLNMPMGNRPNYGMLLNIFLRYLQISERIAPDNQTKDK